MAVADLEDRAALERALRGTRERTFFFRLRSVSSQVRIDNNCSAKNIAGAIGAVGVGRVIMARRSTRSIPTGRDHSSDDSPARRQAHVVWTVSSHLTDGRGLWLALRRTSIGCHHDRALARSKTAMLPGGSPERPKLRESK